MEEKTAREKQLLGEIKKKGDAARQIIQAKDDELSTLREKLRAALEASAALSNSAAAAAANAVHSSSQPQSPVPASGTPRLNLHATAVHFSEHGGEHAHAENNLSDLNTNHDFKPKALFRPASDRAIFTQEEVQCRLYTQIISIIELTIFNIISTTVGGTGTGAQAHSGCVRRCQRRRQ